MPKITVYESKSGKAHSLESVDAREYLAQKDGFYVARNPKAPPPVEGQGNEPAVVLRGSDGMPDAFDLGPKKMPAADLIEAARVAAKLTPAEWNAQPQAAIDKALGQQYEIAKAQALAATVTTGANGGTSKKQ